MTTEFETANAAEAEPYDPLGVAAALVLEEAAGTLATIEAGSGFPLATLVTTTPDADGAPLIFISDLSAHTQNLKRDARFSLLLARRGKGDPLAHPRVTLIGKAEVTRSAEAKARFIASNPKAKLYQDFGDFSLWRLAPERLHFNGGFGKAHAGPAEPLLARIRAMLAG